jgi:hypothetical protein
MALIAQNWTLNAYTNGVWTNLVDALGPTVVKGVVVATTQATAVGLRIVDSASAVLAVLTPGESLTANVGHVADLPTITLENGQKLQVVADVGGATFSAHGAA